MKFTPFILTASLLSMVPAFAADDAKPTAAAASPAADTAWKGIEPLLKGPSTRPKTKEEAVTIFTAYLKDFDTKSEAFMKDYPTDPRRWTLVLHGAELNGMRGFLGMPAQEGLDKKLDEVLASTDADKETKGHASFLRVQLAGAGSDEKYEALATAHLKDYPDFKGNKQIDSEMKRIASEKDLKKNPLELKFTAVDGQEIDLAKMRGKVVLIDFWATWCGPCVAEIPHVVEAYDKLHGKGFEIVGISFDQKDDKAKLEKFTKEHKMPWPQFFDGQGWGNSFGKKYGINSIPRMWLVNKKGMVADTNGRQNLAEKVEKLLAE